MPRLAPGASAKNSCYACHARSQPPNFVDDEELQLRWTIAPAAARNRWTNLFDPPVLRAPKSSDERILDYVRRSNYLDEHGEIPLARTLASLPDAWDGAKDGRWDGYVPDAGFAFDEDGFDRRPDGELSGWRAFGYYPLVGAFLPANGSAGDALIRLDPSLRQDANGSPNTAIYAVNLAIVEALITRNDVPIVPIDEGELGVDLDLNGILSRANRVAFDRSAPCGSHDDPRHAGRMHYVGRAREEERAGRLPIVVGLFPLNTEFLHSVRYLDVASDGKVTMAARMKELRYAKKVRWFGYADLKRQAEREAFEQEESIDGALSFLWQWDRGVDNDRGWLFSGFIEAADGSLRPQSYEETLYCVGCHGGVGTTTDSIFSFPRKVGGARGWSHGPRRGSPPWPDPLGSDGRHEYTRYLIENRAGDDFHANTEVIGRFFDERHSLRPSEVAKLRQDIDHLLLPSAARALDLDRAYRAIVDEQSFTRGRDTALAPVRHIYAQLPEGEKTGIEKPLGNLATRHSR
ncbi:hypothetical protein LVJ94_49825 [Pendulispora rubella]|uniref:Cytochrome c domain-containing protein n=1 Tax=Pendulispora rubella TaxID=2741070 RepID=A0ABZ2L596_9BACT